MLSWVEVYTRKFLKGPAYFEAKHPTLSKEMGLLHRAVIYLHFDFFGRKRVQKDENTSIRIEPDCCTTFSRQSAHLNLSRARQ